MGGRTYRWNLKCPYCQRLYAKRTLWTKHIAKCPANPGRKGTNR